MVEALERGDISFFFRPRVQRADAPAGTATAPGVQSFFFVDDLGVDVLGPAGSLAEPSPGAGADPAA